MCFTGTLVLWFLSFIGVFSHSNGLIYDFFTRTASEEKSPSKVALVVADYEQREAGDSVWLSLVNVLDGMGAQQVIFTFAPGNVTSQFYEDAASRGNVFFGLQKLRASHKGGPEDFEPLPDQARTFKIMTGLEDIPPSQSGIHRLAQSYWVFNGTKYPSVLLAAAEARLSGPMRDEQYFGVNFVGRSSGFPNVVLTQALSGQTVPELFKGKSVLVGFRVPNRFYGLQTPLNPIRGTLSPLEYHAYTLETLLSKRTIQPLGPLPVLVLMMLALLFLLMVSRNFRSIVAVGSALVVALICLLLTGFLLWYAFILFPIMEIVSVLAVEMFLIMLMRSRMSYQSARRILLEKSAEVKARLIPESFFRSQDHWSQVITMVNQTLNLDRAIFLEKVEKDHRVKEVVALNTSISDIQERRRDYKRTPYSSALDERGPVKVSRFFSSAKDSDEQYLIPLNFAGQVQGFWAFVVSSEYSAQIPTLLPIITKFASQLAEMLYRRQEWIKDAEQQDSTFRQMLGLESRERLYEELEDVVALLELRLSLLESAVNSMSTAIVLCDLFGRVLSFNRNMAELLSLLDLIPYQTTALDLAVRLSGREIEEVRMLLSRTVTYEETFILPATVSLGKIERSFLLVVSPMKSQEEVSVRSGAYPFNMYGLLFELREVTELADLNRIKGQIFEKGASHLRQGIESLSNACTLLEDTAADKDWRSQVIDEFHSKREALASSVEELNTYMGKDFFSASLDFLPVDAVEPVHWAIQVLEDQASKRRVTFQVKAPSKGTLALAAPTELQELLYSLLSILLNDAYEDSEVCAEIDLDLFGVFYLFSNSGYGMPDEDLQRFVSSPDLADSKDFERVNKLMPTLKKWRGDLTASSKVGVGTKFKLRLVRSLLST
jgi:hypothetical protein